MPKPSAGRRSGRDDKPAEPSQALAIIVPTAIVRPAIASAMLVPRLAVRSGPPVDNGALQATFGKFRQFLITSRKIRPAGMDVVAAGAYSHGWYFTDPVFHADLAQTFSEP
jgi:hypothetical protein